MFTLYPQAAEGGGCFVPALRRPAVGAARSRAVAAGGGAAGSSEAAPLLRGEPAQPLRDADLRRGGLLDPQQLRADVAEFFRGLRRELGGKPLPYAWASEWHPGGHGLHVHFTVGRYVRQSLIREVWGRGIVHIKLIGDLPVGSGAFEEARLAASYLAKYVSKNVADERRAAVCIATRSRRASSRSGCRYAGGSEEAVLAEASELMGGVPSRVWRVVSGGLARPPAYWCAWAG